ncbi:MAG: PP2C family protein-serine/threonine phosphatase [Acidimicrobiales bacterium]
MSGLPAASEAGDRATHLEPKAPGIRRTVDGTHRRGLHLPTVIVMVVGLAITAGLALGDLANYNQSEARILALRAHDASAVLSETAPAVETPLASATEVAIATNDPARFADLMRPYVKASASTVSISLWRVEAPAPQRLALVGPPSSLAQSPGRMDQAFAEALANKKLNLLKLGGHNVVHLGFVLASATSPGYVALEETAGFKEDLKARVAANDSFSDLYYALYVGPVAKPAALLVTDAPQAQITGLASTIRVPFGASAFTMVFGPIGPLQGDVAESIPWLIGVVGFILTIGVVWLVERLARRRRLAETIAREKNAVADENRRLYDEQRSFVHTLQKAFLSPALPEFADVQLGARYVSGAAGTEVGGDWYDFVKIDEDRLFFVVGDVSGSGLAAATVMVELRFATLAYLSDGSTPEEILTKLGRLHPFEPDGHFATMVCGSLDLGSSELVVANAGHLQPLVFGAGDPKALAGPVGVPIGVGEDHRYEALHTSIPPSGTLLAFTDGLVERRGQPIDHLIGRLAATTVSNEPIDRVLDSILEDFGSDGFDDDTAIIGVRWIQ